jgi:hypothetical protein
MPSDQTRKESATVPTDKRGNRFVEIDLLNGEKLRITHIPVCWTGSPGFRVQQVTATGHVKQGPEIPFNRLGDVVSEAVVLLSGTSADDHADE